MGLNVLERIVHRDVPLTRTPPLSEGVMPIPDTLNVPRSLWEILNDQNSDLVVDLRFGFTPDIEGDPFPVIQLSNQPSDSPYVCLPGWDEEEKREKASIWLNPEIWNDALSEFSKLSLECYSSEPLLLQVYSHLIHRGNESIILLPLSADTRRRSGLKFSLRPNGRLAVMKEWYGIQELGYLHPDRAVNEELELLIHELRNPSQIYP